MLAAAWRTAPLWILPIWIAGLLWLLPAWVQYHNSSDAALWGRRLADLAMGVWVWTGPVLMSWYLWFPLRRMENNNDA